MTKKEISKILSSGTPKQRVKLFFEDLVLKRYQSKGYITDKQSAELYDTFKKGYDVKLYNKWYQLDKKVSNSTMNLQGLKFEVMTNFSNLRGYILTWHKIEEAELLVNSVLHQIKGPERKAIAERANQVSNVMFSKMSIDDEGYFNLDVDFDQYTTPGKKSIFTQQPGQTHYGLDFLIGRVKEETEGSVVKFLSWKAATLQFMKEENFDVKAYQDIIEGMTKDLRKPIIGWIKYLSDWDTFTGEEEPTRVDKMKSIYAVTPDFDKLTVDEDICNNYLKEFLQDE